MKLVAIGEKSGAFDSSKFASAATYYGRIFLISRSGRLFEYHSSEKILAVPEVEDFKVLAIAAGREHVIILTDNAYPVSFGTSNEFGQVGHGACGLGVVAPRLMLGLRGSAVKSVACGEFFTLVLTEQGKIFACGDNSFGQLGLSRKDNSAELVEVCLGDSALVPFRQISCGGDFSVALSLSGTVYVWGSNKHGQLGVGKGYGLILAPKVLDTLGNVTSISCGSHHTAFIARGRQVFFCGDNRAGQCGISPHDMESIEYPVAINLPGKPRAACLGSCHSLVICDTPEEKRALFGFGDSSYRQLGISHPHTVHISPIRIDISGNCIFLSVSDIQNIIGIHTEYELDRTVTIAPQPVRSLTSTDEKFEVSDLFTRGSVDYLSYKNEKISLGGSPPGTHPDSKFNSFSIELLETLAEPGISTAQISVLLKTLYKTFSDPVLLSSSFLVPGTLSPLIDIESLGFNIQRILDVFTTFENELISACYACCDYLSSHSSFIVNEDQMRSLVILFLIPEYSKRFGTQLAAKLATLLYKLSPVARMSLVKLMGSQVSLKVVFRQITLFWVQLAENQLKLLRDQPSREPIPRNLFNIFLVLHLLHLANDKINVDKQIFHLGWLGTVSIDDSSSLFEREIRMWRHFWRSQSSLPTSRALVSQEYQDSGPPTALLSILVHYVFIPAAFKQSLLFMNNRISQADQEQQLLAQQAERVLSLILRGIQPMAFNLIEVRRDNLLNDTIRQIENADSKKLRLPIRVKFLGEEGVDEGGVTREFFSLIGNRMFDPHFGMFKLIPESRCIWFDWPLDENIHLYRIIGVILGLAVYNNFPGFDIPFPKAFFKKLRGESLHFEDLADVYPAETRSLKSLLEWSDTSTVEDSFGLYFTISFDYFGLKKTIELKPGGENIGVNGSNREEFAELYKNWLLTECIRSSFESFSAGFRSVCSDQFLWTAFTSEDLQKVVCGSSHEECRLSELELNCHYDGGFVRDEPYIRGFWDILGSLDARQRKLFLTFVTGSDRIPLGGLSKLKITIQQNGSEPTLHLPTAYTCFNVLLLPRYSSQEKLKNMFFTAIENCEGFGLR
jgi:alpha-tubulin suppressor-like RCC1 family protein